MTTPLGARVIFFCLLEMVLSKKQTSGIIENAVMLGAPVSSNEAVWSKLCTQVSGKPYHLRSDRHGHIHHGHIHVTYMVTYVVTYMVTYVVTYVVTYMVTYVVRAHRALI